MTMLITEVVVDTNVAVVANNTKHPAGQDCVRSCLDALRYVRGDCRVLLDDSDLILGEYRRHLCPSGQPGLGDAFFKWLFDNQGDPAHCRRISVHPHPDRGFEEFPPDPSLSSFDLDDRKFVAMALASGGSPQILNASDTDWWQYRRELKQNGVAVTFLCPDLMDS